LVISLVDVEFLTHSLMLMIEYLEHWTTGNLIAADMIGLTNVIRIDFEWFWYNLKKWIL